MKVLANGELKSAVTVHAHKFSKAAQKAIEDAGGKAIVIGSRLLRQRKHRPGRSPRPICFSAVRIARTVCQNSSRAFVSKCAS